MTCWILTSVFSEEVTFLITGFIAAKLDEDWKLPVNRVYRAVDPASKHSVYLAAKAFPL